MLIRRLERGSIRVCRLLKLTAGFASAAVSSRRFCGEFFGSVAKWCRLGQNEPRSARDRMAGLVSFVLGHGFAQSVAYNAIKTAGEKGEPAT